MKRALFLATIAAVVFPGVALAEVGVGLSVSVGEPGFYGAIDIGNAPPPVLYSPQPVLMAPVPVGVAAFPPLYLRVPPGHRKDWRHHCAEYNACNRPVYFVKDGWYNNVYAPHYKQHRDFYQGRREYEDRRQGGRPEEPGRGNGRGEERGHGPDR